MSYEDMLKDPNYRQSSMSGKGLKKKSVMKKAAKIARKMAIGKYSDNELVGDPLAEKAVIEQRRRKNR